MWYLVIAIVSFIIAGVLAKISAEDDTVEKLIVSIIACVFFLFLGGFMLQKYTDYCYNEAIIHYQNGDYVVIKHSDGELTYKIIPTDYD